MGACLVFYGVPYLCIVFGVAARQPLKVLEDIHSGGLVMQILDLVFLLLYGKYKAYMYILLII